MLTSLNLSIPPEIVLHGWLAGWLAFEHQSGEISSVCLPDE